MDRHHFSSISSRLSTIQSQLSALETSIGALHCAIDALLMTDRDILDASFGNEEYEKGRAADMARRLILIEGVGSVHRYLMENALWNWALWEEDNMKLREERAQGARDREWRRGLGRT
jgi:hypothetical protein